MCGQFFGPAISASIPQLVPNHLLEKANSLNQVTATMVNIVGYAVGGVMVAFLGVPLLLFINGASFLLSAFSEMFIHIPKLAREKAVLSASLFVRDIKDGFKYVRDNPVLLRILQIAMMLNFFGAPFFILLPKFVNEHMGAGSEVYGYLLSAQMVGALVSILILSTTSLIQKNLWIVRWSLVAQAVAFISVPFLPVAFWGIHVSLFMFGGMLNSVLNIYFSTLMQRATPPEYMGKVFGLVGTMCQALQPVSMGFTGVVAEVVRLPIIYTVCNLGLGIGGFQFASIPGLMGFLGAKKEDSLEESGEPVPAPV
jgi:MFS family permease